MKKLLLLLLAFAISLTLFACGGGEDPCDKCVDNDSDGFCDKCDEKMPDGEHTCSDRKPKDGICDVCGESLACDECIDEDKDGECDDCGNAVECVEHINANEDRKCDVCKKTIPACSKCIDENENNKCDKCGKTVESDVGDSGDDEPDDDHVCLDEDGDEFCDECGDYVKAECDECVDEDDDGFCDICDEVIVCKVHINEDEDVFCDKCGELMPACDECADANGNNVCDTCGETMPCKNHVNEDEDRACDVCDSTMPVCAKCVDKNSNLKCDVCGSFVPCAECVDDDDDRICDVCGNEIPCDECIDLIKDLICDVCDEPIELPDGSIILIDDGDVDFQFVFSSDIDLDSKKYLEQTLIAELRNKYSLTVKAFSESAKNYVPREIEVIVGTVDSLGDEYFIDPHTLGKNGYAIKLVGSKIVINAGSPEMLLSTLRSFASNILGVNGEGNDIYSVAMTPNNSIVKPQDDYAVKSLSVNGSDLKGYTIAAELTRKYYSDAALALQDKIYENTGYWLTIVDIENATDKSIILRHAAKVSGDESFKVYADGANLIIDCAYDNKLGDATASFVLEKIASGSGSVNFTGTVYKQDISVVYYEEFGADPKGKEDSFEAIYYTHEFANECGQTVKASKGARYYIYLTYFKLEGATKETLQKAIIKTNVDWGNAEFIIDDRALTLSAITSSSDINTKMNTYLFEVVPDDNLKEITISDAPTLKRMLADGINRHTTNIEIDVGWDGPVMIIPYNSSHKVYRRRGYGGFAGGDMHECIVLDKDGNISEETPVMFDYQNLTKVLVYRLDESTALTIEGGVFTTRASQANLVYTTATGAVSSRSTYFYRSLMVSRSFTTVKNVKHLVTDEVGLSGQVDSNGNIIYVAGCYNGFFTAQNANHVTFEGCTLQGRRCYQRPQGGTGGTYDLTGNTVNKIVFKNCEQNNFWVSVDEDYVIRAAMETTLNALPSMASVEVNGKSLKMHWGIGGTNYCKNMEYIGSTLSRFDAHAGLYNGKVIDSTVNYLAITGNGDFIVENVRYFAEGTGYGSNSLFHLRADYGSTWEGEIDLKNVDAYVYSNAAVYLFYHSYTNWYYGYQACFPSISIDNLNYYNISNYQPLPEGYTIYITGSNVSKSSQLHLAQSHTNAIFSIEDNDGDGFIDEPTFDRNRDGVVDGPIDLDGDGKIGNTSYQYSVIKNSSADYTDGYTSNLLINLNMIRPPEYIKIINNDGVDTNGDGRDDSGPYTFVVTNTAESGKISDGGYWDDVETYGGFYGDTKFIYGDGAGDYFVGPDHVGQTKTKTFRFE